MLSSFSLFRYWWLTSPLNCDPNMTSLPQVPKIPYSLHLSNTKGARESTTVNITESTVGHGWLTPACDYEPWIVSTATLDVSLRESLYWTDRQLVNPSAHPDDDGRRELPALVWCDTFESTQPQLIQTVEIIGQGTSAIQTGSTLKALCKSGLFSGSEDLVTFTCELLWLGCVIISRIITTGGKYFNRRVHVSLRYLRFMLWSPLESFLPQITD